MREILFKGFYECEDGKTLITVNGEKKRGTWIEGIPYQDKNGTTFIILTDKEHLSIPPYGHIIRGEVEMPLLMEVESFEVLPETVSQYTGLTDKNGKKIFENDIVKWGHIEGSIESPIRIANITYEKRGYVYNSQVGKFYQGSFWYGERTEKCVEVIGNIFDNPELLKTEE